MTSAPNVSVVTPSFNQAPFLEQTIRSVLDQGYPNLEYLVMDGGSTDGSVEIIKRYADRLAYWVSKPDGGQAEAINHGWQRATGEILAYLNSDDFYYPGAILRAVDYLDRHPEVDILYGSEQTVDECGRRLGPIVTVPDFSLKWLLRYPLPQPTMFFRRAAFERVGWLDPSFHYVFDWEFNIRAAMAGMRIARLDPPEVAAFRCWSGQKTSSSFDKHVAEQLRMRDQLASREAVSPQLVRELRFSKAWAFLYPAYQYYLQGRMAEARRYLQQAKAIDWRIAWHPEFTKIFVRSLLGRQVSGLARKAKSHVTGAVS